MAIATAETPGQRLPRGSKNIASDAFFIFEMAPVFGHQKNPSRDGSDFFIFLVRNYFRIALFIFDISSFFWFVFEDRKVFLPSPDETSA